MWEWTNNISFGKKNTSLLSAYEDVLHKQTQKFYCKTPDKEISEAGIRSLLEDIISELALKNITLKKFSYTPETWEEMRGSFDIYQRSRIAFLKLIVYEEEECLRKLGLKDYDLNLMRKGVSPENFNIHIKVPFDFGGQPTLANVSFMKTHPTHDYFHKLLDLQIEKEFLQKSKTIFIPCFEGRIYHD